MRKIKDVLRLKHEARLSHEKIAAALRISKGVVTKYAGLAETAGLRDWPSIEGLEEAELEQRLLPRVTRRHSEFVLPDYGRIHQELRRKGVTLMLLWEEYQADHAGGQTWQYTQFCEHYRQFAQRLKRSMRQLHRAGEKLFIDYAGPTVALSDGTHAHMFVAVLGASGYTFACATPHERMSDWLEATAAALTFINGVPQLIVPDNPRAMIARPDRYEPLNNETVQDFARHYGTSVLPARPRHPQDKARVESGVQVVERWILARLRKHRFDSVYALNQAIAPLLESLNQRAFQKLPGSRASAFAQLDRPALQPLPVRPYEIAHFKSVKVHIDYHVEIAGHRYSVPHALVGQSLQARVTRHAVELLLRGQRVASHVRSERRGGFTTVDEHMPAAHRAHRQWTPQRLIHWGHEIGPATARVVTQLLERFRHPEQGYRSCLGLLSLSKKYGRVRLEAACALALTLPAQRYRDVREILLNHRERITPSAQTDWISPVHQNVRGPAYYH
jgi:transposase